MSRLFTILLLSGCFRLDPGTDTTAGEGAEVGGAGEGADGPDSADTAAPVTGYSLVLIGAGEIPDLTGPKAALFSGTNDYTYLLDEDGQTIRYLTNALVHPTGDWCLSAPASDPDCAEGGPDWTSGRIVPSAPVAAMCLDEDSGDLFLVRPGKPVEVADVAREGRTDRTYNKVSRVFRLPDEVATGFAGPCAAGPAGLLLSDEAAGTLALVDSAGVLLGQTLSGGGVDHLLRVGDDRALAVDAAGGRLSLWSLPGLTPVGDALSLGAAITDISVDAAAGRYWAIVDGSVVTAPLGEAPRESLALDLTVSRIAADPSTGLAYAVGTGDGGLSLLLLSTGGLVASTPLDAPVVGMVPPGDRGDLVLITAPAGAALRFVAFDAWPDQPRTDVAPLSLFIATNIEEPSDDMINKPCLGLDTDTVEREVAVIRANADVLEGLGVPVSLGITYNFSVAVERCGMTDIFADLASRGFTLGTMVHNRPCYSCTNKDVRDVTPDECAPSSPYYCDPERGGDCCFPDDPDYCLPGDQSCYMAYIDARNVVVDRNIPGGGRFVISADRHGMWDWDWVNAYATMARADGSRGYDLSYFAQTWANYDVVYDDARGKDPTPWRPSAYSEPWMLGPYTAWDDASAYSDLLYLPGLNTATLKLDEWHRSGLFLLDYLNEGGSVSWSEADFTIVEHYLREALNHRSAYGPQVFYFHIHDLGLTNNLKNADGAETDGATFLRAFVQRVNETYVAPGHAVWASPTELRAQWSAE